MFIGHDAIAFASRRLAPRPSLGTLFLAVNFLDLLWPIFLLMGVEHVRVAPGNTAFTPLDFYDYPWSHSLVMSVVWAALFALVYFVIRRDGRGALVCAAGVFSHWVLDWITHRPDLPLSPWTNTKAGLGLWQSVPGTMIIESLLFVISVVLYARATRPRNRVGTWSLIGLIVVLAVMYVSLPFSPPPPGEHALAVFGLLSFLIPAWGYWIDRNRITNGR